MGRRKINCKDGLEETQELEARRIRSRLLNVSERESVYLELNKLFEEYNYSNTFLDYLKTKNPSLYSACKRVKLQLMIIDRKLVIKM